MLKTGKDKKKMKKEARAEGERRRKELYEKRIGTWVKPVEEKKERRKKRKKERKKVRKKR